MKRLLLIAAVALLVFSGVYGEGKTSTGKKDLNKLTNKFVGKSAAAKAAIQ